jgi:hypothetical protein
METLWSLVMLTILLLLIVAATKLGRLIKEKWGIPATLLFILVLFAFIGKGSRSDNLKNVSFKEPNNLEKNIDYQVATTMRKSLTTRYNLDIQFGRDTLTGRYIPLSASASLSGIFYGYGWKPGIVSVTTSGDNRYFQYFISGVKEWRIFGTTIFTEDWDLEGKVPIHTSVSKL